MTLVTLPEFAKEMQLSYNAASNMLSKVGAPEPEVQIGNRRAWDEEKLKAYVRRRYSHVLEYLGIDYRSLKEHYNEGFSAGLAEARKTVEEMIPGE